MGSSGRGCGPGRWTVLEYPFFGPRRNTASAAQPRPTKRTGLRPKQINASGKGVIGGELVYFSKCEEGGNGWEQKRREVRRDARMLDR